MAKIQLTLEERDWLLQEFKISFYGKYVETRDAINFRCPFCGDSKKSLTKRRGWLYKKEGSFHCYNCGKTTSGFGLLAQIQSKSPKSVKRACFEACQDLSKYFENNNFQDNLLEQHQAKLEANKNKEYIEPLASWTDLTEECQTYLKARHIFDAPGFNKKSYLYYDTFLDRIIFPWRERGKIVYYQARAIRKGQEPKYLFPKGLKKKIYGIDQIEDDLPFICYTEGLLDSIFIRNCLAVGGLKPSIEQTETLKNKFPEKEFVWFTDNFWVDNSSKEAILKQVEVNPRQKIFNWPRNCRYKDINEWVCKEKNYSKFWDSKFLQKNFITCAQAKIALKLNF